MLNKPTRAIGATLVTAGAGLLLAGCTASVDAPPRFTVAPEDYPRAFDATRDVLRSMDFHLDRVDAASGVISTDLHFSQGMFDPGDSTQTGFGQEWEDGLNYQGREVRVTFAPVDGDAPADLRAGESQLLATVQAVVFRRHRAGRRLDSENVGASSFYQDPDLNRRHGSRYDVPVRRDERLESRIAARITESLASSEAED